MMNMELPAQLPEHLTITVEKFNPFTVEYCGELEYVDCNVYVVLPPTNIPLEGIKGKPRKIQAVAVEIEVTQKMCMEEFLGFLADMKDELETIWKNNRDLYISRMYAN